MNTDQQLEQAIIMIIRTMREAAKTGAIHLIPDLNQKLLLAVSEYMTK